MTGEMSVTKLLSTTRRRKRLRTDESGAVDAAGYIVLTTLVVLGLIVGLVTVRDQIVQQLGDIAAAIASLDQSYTFTIGTQTSTFVDTADPVLTSDPAGAEPAGISVQAAATPEGN